MGNKIDTHNENSITRNDGAICCEMAPGKVGMHGVKYTLQGSVRLQHQFKYFQT